MVIVTANNFLSPSLLSRRSLSGFQALVLAAGPSTPGQRLLPFRDFAFVPQKRSLPDNHRLREVHSRISCPSINRPRVSTESICELSPGQHHGHLASPSAVQLVSTCVQMSRHLMKPGFAVRVTPNKWGFI
jgi:hypothetical protein